MAPGRTFSSDAQFRPAIGRYSMSFVVTTSPRELVSSWTESPAVVTVSVCAALPTSNWSCPASSLSPAVRLRFAFTSVLKPLASTFNVYEPGKTPAKRNRPSDSDFVLVLTLVFVSVMVTVAAGRTAPLESTTKPEIDPRVIWAFAGKVTTRAINAPATASQPGAAAFEASPIRFLMLPSPTDVVVISDVLPFLLGTLSHKARPLRIKLPVRNQILHRHRVVARPQSHVVVKGIRLSHGIHIEFYAQPRPFRHIHPAGFNS